MIREFSFGPLGFVPLGFGSLNHGIWPSIRVLGVQGYKLKVFDMRCMGPLGAVFWVPVGLYWEIWRKRFSLMDIPGTGI